MMPRKHFTVLPSVLRVFVLALVASLLPLGTAFAQSRPQVRVTSEKASVTSMRDAKSEMITTVTEGTVLTVVYTSGDPYAHQDTNWYFVQLPPDAFGRGHTGWISGRSVEEFHPPAPPAPAAVPAPEPTPAVEPPAQPVRESQKPQTVAKAPPAGDCPDEPVRPAKDRSAPPEVVVHFAFDKSELTGQAKQSLDDGVKMMETSGAKAMSFALEGYTDATGPYAYNDRLGLARAESVKRYLAEQHHIAPNRISVTSYGEDKPAASNGTRDGRAANRRVVVKIAS